MSVDVGPAVSQPSVGIDAAERAGSQEAWLRAARRARRLASFSLAWLCFEGAATTTAGLIAGSVALIGNGLDGAIEGLASVIIVWRFSGARTLSGTSERRAQRLVAISFFLLAPFIAYEATRALVVEHHADTTWLGVGLSVATLLICPWLGRAKLRLGAQLGSSATAGEGRQNLICAYLAVAVLVGLLANNLFWGLVARLCGRAGYRSTRATGGASIMARRELRLHFLFRPAVLKLTARDVHALRPPCLFRSNRERPLSRLAHFCFREADNADLSCALRRRQHPAEGDAACAERGLSARSGAPRLSSSFQQRLRFGPRTPMQ